MVYIIWNVLKINILNAKYHFETCGILLNETLLKKMNETL